MTFLTTARLELRAWSDDDLDAYAALTADPEVMRFLGGPLDRDGAWRQMALFAGHGALRGWTQSAVVERATGRLIGRGGLWRPEGWPGLEVGWVLARAAQGRGYAAELGRAVRDRAAEWTGEDHLISLIDPANEASLRVARAVGHRHEREVDLDGHRVEVWGQDLRP